MEAHSRSIQIHHAIQRSDGSRESYHYETQGDYYRLNHYSKVIYRDVNDQTVSLKWYHPRKAEAFVPSIELTQESGKFDFILDQITRQAYRVAGLTLDLEVLTHSLSIDNPLHPQRIICSYQLKQGEQSLGQYEFRLIFMDEEVKI